jgi:hypothetical protein
MKVQRPTLVPAKPNALGLRCRILDRMPMASPVSGRQGRWEDALDRDRTCPSLTSSVIAHTDARTRGGGGGGGGEGRFNVGGVHVVSLSPSPALFSLQSVNWRCGGVPAGHRWCPLHPASNSHLYRRIIKLTATFDNALSLC